MVTLDGMMTFGKLGNGLTVADFKNYDPEQTSRTTTLRLRWSRWPGSSRAG